MDNIKNENVSVFNRERFNMCGVVNIEAFDEEYVLLAVDKGRVGIEGDGLKITSLTKEYGEITVIGNIKCIMFYSENEGRGKRGRGVFK